jgi:hypothetical protein
MSGVLVVHSGELGELLAAQFVQYGISATSANSGEEALERALDVHPVALVIDADLADVAGLELAELLRGELKIPALLTYPAQLGRGPEGEAFLARLAALEGGFARPFRSLELIAKVAELIGAELRTPSGATPTDSLPTGEPVILLDDAIDDAIAGIDGMTALSDALDGIDALERDLPTARPTDAPPTVEGPAEMGLATAEDFSLPSMAPIESLAGALPAGIEIDDDELFDLALDLDESLLQVDRIDEDSRPPQPARPAGESASRALSDFVAEPPHADPADLVLLWKRILARHEDHAVDVTSPPAQPAAAGARRLTPHALAEVLDAFHQSRSTGEIWLSRRNRRRALLLRRGRIVGARSNVSSEELPQIAKRRALVSEEHLRYAAETLARRDAGAKSLVAALQAAGVHEATLRTMLDERARRAACGAFAWREGEIRVTYRGHAANEPLPLQISVGDVILRGIVLTESLEDLREAAPDDARFAPHAEGAYGLDELTLTADEAHLVVAIDGTKTVADLAVLFPRMHERVLRGVIAGLFRVNLLRLGGRGEAAPRRISFF